MAKSIAVSTDDVTYYTLPGNTGEFNKEAAGINDTIFGQDFQSSEVGLINWNMSAQAFYKGFAGYIADVKKAGTATNLVAQGMSLVSGKTYKVSDATKNILNPSATFTVLDGVTNVNAQVESFNYLFGQLTFKSSYTPVGAITIAATGGYYPVTTLGKANAFTLTQSSDTIDSTDFATAQGNGGHRTFVQGLKTVSLELTGFYDVTNEFRENLTERDLLIIEINPDGNSKSVARGFFKIMSEGQSGEVGALEEESTTFELQVPSSDYLPFSWQFASDTTLHQSIRTCLNAWLTGDEIYVRYLHDGTNGVKGTCIVNETSLSSGLENMNEYTMSFQGSGATTEVGDG